MTTSCLSGWRPSGVAQNHLEFTRHLLPESLNQAHGSHSSSPGSRRIRCNTAGTREAGGAQQVHVRCPEHVKAGDLETGLGPEPEGRSRLTPELQPTPHPPDPGPTEHSPAQQTRETAFCDHSISYSSVAPKKKKNLFVRVRNDPEAEPALLPAAAPLRIQGHKPFPKWFRGLYFPAAKRKIDEDEGAHTWSPCVTAHSVVYC